MKISNRAYGLDSISSEMSVEVGNKVCNGMAYISMSLRFQKGNKYMECLFYRNSSKMLRKRVMHT